MEEQPPEDATRKRFEELLAAKKKANQAGNTPEAQRETRPARPQSAKGGRGFTRRKV